MRFHLLSFVVGAVVAILVTRLMAGRKVAS